MNSQNYSERNQIPKAVKAAFFLYKESVMKTFDSIKISHGITDRTGGVSQGVYASMNTSFFGDDDRDHVFENIKRSLDAIGCDAKIIVATQQIHSNHIVTIDLGTDFQAFHKIETAQTALDDYLLYVVPECDGLLTHRSDVVLMTFYADCVPLVFYDPNKNIAATVHSGWKGTSNKMCKTAIDTLVSHGCDAKDIKVGIGQSAGVCCYEVDTPVIDLFSKNFTQSEMNQFVFNKEEVGKYAIDLKKANEILCLASGILKEHIEIIDDCTLCNSELYFSHRRTGYPRGSMSAFIQIK